VLRTMMKSKIHRARLTQADLAPAGSGLRTVAGT
jgi:aspartate 1-decarboxylase